jgi:hypothetical protein
MFSQTFLSSSQVLLPLYKASSRPSVLGCSFLLQAYIIFHSKKLEADIFETSSQVLHAVQYCALVNRPASSVDMAGLDATSTRLGKD